MDNEKRKESGLRTRREGVERDGVKDREKLGWNRG